MRAFLFRIANNLALDYLRGLARSEARDHGPLDESVACRAPQPDSAVAARWPNACTRTSPTRSPRPHVARRVAYRGLAALPARHQDWRSDHHTASGQQTNVTLTDGSRITLNTDTVLSVDFSKQKRRIELRRGEAFFEVRRTKPTPLSWEAAIPKPARSAPPTA